MQDSTPDSSDNNNKQNNDNNNDYKNEPLINSALSAHDNQAKPQQRESRRLLTTGCGRSGTLYASQVWQALGLDVRHERPVPPNGVVGKDGIASWLMTVEDPNPPFGPSALHYQFQWTIHQVRHPLATIASVAQFIFRGQKPWQYVVRNVPAIGTGLPPHKQLRDSPAHLCLAAMRYWLHWNQLAQQKADITLRLEDLTEKLPALCETLGFTPQHTDISAISNKTNSREKYIKNALWQVSWQDLEVLDAALSQQIKQMASEYGYTID